MPKAVTPSESKVLSTAEKINSLSKEEILLAFHVTLMRIFSSATAQHSLELRNGYILEAFDDEREWMRDAIKHMKLI